MQKDETTNKKHEQAFCSTNAGNWFGPGNTPQLKGLQNGDSRKSVRGSRAAQSTKAHVDVVEVNEGLLDASLHGEFSLADPDTWVVVLLVGACRGKEVSVSMLLARQEWGFDAPSGFSGFPTWVARYPAYLAK